MKEQTCSAAVNSRKIIALALILDLIIHPKGKKEFNKYGNTFFYKSVKLGTGIKLNDIIDIIISDVNQIEANFTKIKSLIEK